MRKLVLFLSLSFFTAGVLQANTSEGTLKVRGTVYAMDGEGVIHKLVAKLLLPVRGEGDIVIHLHDLKHNKKKTVKALKHFVTRKNGRSVFYIVFPHEKAGEVVVMRGSYMRDSAVALYSGDIFVGELEEAASLSPENVSASENFRFKGSFFFKKRVESNQ